MTLKKCYKKTNKNKNSTPIDNTPSTLPPTATPVIQTFQPDTKSIIHTVVEGETIEGIARKILDYPTNVKQTPESNRKLTSLINEMLRINEIENPTKLQIGTVLQIPIIND
jgi:nucleoid-associated protein YgaU